MIREADTVSLPGLCLSTRHLIAALHFIATPLPLILLACPCLSTRHLHLPPPVQLSFAPASCRVASRCPTFATHPLDPQPFLSTRRLVVAMPLVDPASAACPLGALLPLEALPLSPTPFCLLFALAGGRVTSHHTAFTTHPLYALLPLNAPAGCSVAPRCAPLIL
jgi:hypothetical protein